MAQTITPSRAQINRMVGGGATSIVVICPPTNEDTAYAVVQTASLKLPTNAWQPLPLVSRLGIELLYAKPVTSKHPLFTVGGAVNTTIAALTLDCDPNSASFGKSTRTAMGGVAFKFADPLQQLSKAVLQPLESFITERLTAIKNALAGPGGVALATAEYEKLGPQAFKMVFKKHRAEQRRLYPDPSMGWAKLECPVVVTVPSCEACGKVEDTSDGGKAMMRCGRCKNVLYCGKGCQEEDWKAHKQFCLSK
ncbi:hypothetical protein LTR56_007316 [Elasticomyces elasticus]|nr:hypothetical protein LTR56_007316 [Elasticomyces elasticus]KAK3662952.1 hypothetical protein LTR22_006116 [Elasticomyces elasticus]KAK4918930.1 hypothetical protein LTR49_013402 [Elasticomyces elasticus]KAK5753815.1 hypothetical protein LTS12_016124 [Elasticomyces elasticus]